MGDGPYGRTEKKLASLHGGSGKGLHVVQPGYAGFSGPAQGGRRGQHKPYAREGAWPAHAGQTPEIGGAYIKSRADIVQRRSENFRGAVSPAPLLSAEQLFVIGDDDLQHALGSIENKFKPGGICAHDPLPNQPAPFTIRQMSL